MPGIHAFDRECAQRRRGTQAHSTKRLRAVALTVAVGTTVLAALGCDSGESATQDPGGGPEPAFVITIDIPSEIKPPLEGLVRELGKAICARSNNCCPRLSMPPLSDCMEAGGGLFLTQIAMATRTGEIDPSELVYAFDNTVAKAWLDVARAHVNDCTFDGEFSFAWVGVCQHVLDVRRKEQPYAECNGPGDDEICVVRHGTGYGCRENMCVPVVQVPRGAGCGVRLADKSVLALCSSNDICDVDLGVCVPLVGLGERCESAEQCAGTALCETAQLEKRCVAGAPVGAACRGPDEVVCERGLYCECDQWGCKNPRCVVPRAVGESCGSNAECGYPGYCDDGICKDPTFNLCSKDN